MTLGQRLLAALLALVIMFAFSATLRVRWNLAVRRRRVLVGFICDPRGRGRTAMSAQDER